MKESFPSPQPQEEHKKEPEKGGFLKKIAIMAGLATAGTGSLANEGKTAEKELVNPEHAIEAVNPSDTTKETANTAEFKDGISIYTSAKTKEGAITPTGLSNSFLENNYGVTFEDIGLVAKKYGFRTSSNLDFQTDMVNYLKEKHPEIIDSVLQKIGTTTHGKNLEKEKGASQAEIGAEALLDNQLGRRVAFMISKLKEKEVKKIIPETPKNTKETREGKPKYVVNIRGDEYGDAGVYYFPESEKDIKELASKVPGRLEEKDGFIQFTADMNLKVFKNYYLSKDEIKNLAGSAWSRDPHNPKIFIKAPEKEDKDVAKN